MKTLLIVLVAAAAVALASPASANKLKVRNSTIIGNTGSGLDKTKPVVKDSTLPKQTQGATFGEKGNSGLSVGAQAADEAWRKAITANNLDGIMAVYSENAVMWLPDAPEAKGREAIRKSYAALLAANTVTSVTFANTHYETTGNHSMGWGDFTLTLSPKSGGDPVTLFGRFSVLARKEAGTWVYVVDHASAHPSSVKPN